MGNFKLPMWCHWTWQEGMHTSLDAIINSRPPVTDGCTSILPFLWPERSESPLVPTFSTFLKLLTYLITLPSPLPGDVSAPSHWIYSLIDLFGSYLQAWKRGSKSQRSSPLGADFITWLQTSARLDQEYQAKTVLKPREELSDYKGNETWDGAVKAGCGGTGQNGLSFSENIFGVLKIRRAFS